MELAVAFPDAPLDGGWAGWAEALLRRGHALCSHVHHTVPRLTTTCYLCEPRSPRPELQIGVPCRGVGCVLAPADVGWGAAKVCVTA
jgi:hypothetical protein